MTQQQKNEAVARALGWKAIPKSELGRWQAHIWKWEAPDGCRYKELPWCTDFNAVQRDLVPVIEERKLWPLLWHQLQSLSPNPEAWLMTIPVGAAVIRLFSRLSPEQLVDAWLACMEGK